MNYKEWKNSINTIQPYEHKFKEILLFLLNKKVINCVEGQFQWNKYYVLGYIIKFNRFPNFCINHLRYFEDYCVSHTKEVD